MTTEEKARKPESALYGLMWWSTLLIAVIAVPTLGVTVALASGGQSELILIGVFVITCWASVWLGMWLVRKADKYHAARR